MQRGITSLAGILFLFFAGVVTFAQTTGSINGTVTDANGALIAGAKIQVGGANGQEFTTTTNENGIYRIPAVGAGVYTVTITAPNFKKTVIENVKVDVGLPATANASMQVGGVDEIVTVTSGGEVLQTQTATVGTTITGRQITETPVASRDALDLVGLLPGTATVGRPRTATINGLPKGTLAITLDGVDVQVNDARSSDGYFTYVRPRLDAIEEVTVSTAAPGAESSGDGAIQIKFVTKRGSNEYHGGLFMQHRNEALNANYWYLNRNPVGLDENGASLRQKIRLFQYGGNASGPIPFPRFGEGGPRFDSGKDKAFFFINYEEFRNPTSQTRTRKVMTPDAYAGIYKYRAAKPLISGSRYLPPFCEDRPDLGANQMECSRNIYDMAASIGQLSTQDPIVKGVYDRIRNAIGSADLVPIPSNPNLLDYNTLATSTELRKFLAMRFDVNLTKDHSVEAVINRQSFNSTPDLLNSREARFPGFPEYSQISDRNSYSFAVRSTFAQNLINEARYAIQEGGPTVFFGELTPSDFDYMDGYNLGIFPTLGGTGVTGSVSTTTITDEKNPVYDFTDSVTWIKGSHSVNFGGQYKRIVTEANDLGRVVPSVGFALNSSTGSPDLPMFNLFNNSGCNAIPLPATCTMPGATSGQLTEIRNFYAMMVGRVSSYTSTAFLNTDTGVYEENARAHRLAEQKSYGLYVQDSWKLRPNFTINYGVRWQPQTGFIAKTAGNYTKLESYDQLWGVSGVGNLFKPGTLTGTAPRVVPVEIGESVYPTDWNNFAPTIGVVWSPDFSSNGFLRTIFGKAGQSVFRGGYSVAFVREGTNLLALINGANPGGTRSLSRSSTIAGSLTRGTNLRDPNNPNLAPFEPIPIIGQAPDFPIALGTTDSTNAFEPGIKTGQVTSFSFGYQRELDRNTVVEVRYVGTRGSDLQRQINLNEFNTIENGFASEFMLAQDNLYRNIAAGRGATFAYFGGASGTHQLPIMLAYFNTAANFDPTNPARYSSTNFANSTLVRALSRNAPNIATFSGTQFEDDAVRRANAIANGLPPNFFYLNPATPTGGAWTVDNTNETWYNSAVVEVRRRLSDGLRINANYVFSKAMANAFTADAGGGGGLPPTVRDFGYDLARNVQISDIRHQFKFDATYDLPFGAGREFFSGTNPVVNHLISGWSISPVIRWQSGSPINLGNVQLVGMDRDELQEAIKIRKEDNLVFWLPDDIILNTQRAFDVVVANTSDPTLQGYGTQFDGGGPPQGRFIAPSGYGNCVSTFGGECGFSRLVVYGPSFFKLDTSVAKTTKFGERMRVELRATILDVLNHPNFRVTAWTGDTASPAIGGATFGQLGNGAAYLDFSTTNDPGGRVIDLMLRIIF